jgi:hypothetical protein
VFLYLEVTLANLLVVYLKKLTVALTTALNGRVMSEEFKSLWNEGSLLNLWSCSITSLEEL